MAQNHYNFGEFRQILDRLLGDEQTHMFILSYTRFVDASYHRYIRGGELGDMMPYSGYWNYVHVNDVSICEIIHGSQLYPFSVHDGDSWNPFNTWQK
jgi:hypothetical protein